MKILLEKGILHGDCLTITGVTVAENLLEVSAQPDETQDVVRSWKNPLYAEGHLAILNGNLAEENAVAKILERGRSAIASLTDSEWRRLCRLPLECRTHYESCRLASDFVAHYHEGRCGRCA